MKALKTKLTLEQFGILAEAEPRFQKVYEFAKKYPPKSITLTIGKKRSKKR